MHSHHQVLAVYTQPDRPSGRGLKLTPSPVKELALSYQLPVHQPVSLKDEREQEILAAFHPDVMVVAAYGLLLPSAVLSIPRLGCVNIHPSLLPRWRGAAPIQRAIFAGDTHTGVTIMQMDQGLDTGPMLLQREYQMTADETSQTLLDRLAKAGADALIEALDLMAQDRLQPKPRIISLPLTRKKSPRKKPCLIGSSPPLYWSILSARLIPGRLPILPGRDKVCGSGWRKRCRKCTICPRAQ